MNNDEDACMMNMFDGAYQLAFMVFVLLYVENLDEKRNILTFYCPPPNNKLPID